MIQTWIMVIDDVKQTLYFVEKPTYHFKPKVRKPLWNPIVIEMPVRALDKTKKWLEGNVSLDLEIKCLDGHNRVIRLWSLQGAKAKTSYVRKSRFVDMNVMEVLVTYSWANMKG